MWSLQQSGAIEPVRADADLTEVSTSNACVMEEFVDGVEKAPGTVRINRNVAVQFAGGREGFAFFDGNGIFKPEPVFRLVGIENESGFAVGVIAIPVGIAKSLVDAMRVEGTHQGLNGHAGCSGVCR